MPMTHDPQSKTKAIEDILAERAPFLSTVDFKKPKSRRILMVDDNEELLHLLSNLLDTVETTFDVDFCMTGSGALGLIQSYCYDAVVLDVKLPDLTGATIVPLVREFDETIPLAFFTNYDILTVKELADKYNLKVWTKTEMLSNSAFFVDELHDLVKDGRCENHPKRRRPVSNILSPQGGLVHVSDPARIVVPRIIGESLLRYYSAATAKFG